MSDDNTQKITWKKDDDHTDFSSSKVSNSSDIKNQKTSESKNNDILDLAQRSADQREKNKISEKKENNTINSLQDDIKKLLEEIEEEKKEDVPDINKISSLTKDTSSKNSAPLSAALAAIENKTKESVDNKEISPEEIKQKKEDFEKQKEAVHEEKINSIKDDIFKEIGNKENPLLDEQTKKLLEEKEKTKGIEETYFSDLSEAMDANKPKTMAELLEKSRYEKKEKNILSIRSKKNIAYIGGAILLLLGIIWFFYVFIQNNKKESVNYITNKKVSSLVYSDFDTGVDLTSVGAEKTKQAVRGVLSEEFKKDSLKQIYYVDTDTFGNKRRIGIKQVFEKTNTNPPELLFKNIENNFMHGVYRGDKNYPFIILKAISYDRAFEGMKEWEPTMIDDLSPYLNLPEEAKDRSLLENGFSDALIKNKTARVARFLPREKDRDKGVFGKISDFITGDNKNTKVDNSNQDLIKNKNNEEDVISNNTTTDEQKNILSYVRSFVIKNIFKPIKPVLTYAEESNFCYETSFTCVKGSGEGSPCSELFLKCKFSNDIDGDGKPNNVDDDIDGDGKPNNIDNIDNICGAIDTSVIAISKIHNAKSDEHFPYSKEKDKDYHYSCLNTVNGDVFIQDVGENFDISTLQCYKDGEKVPYNKNDPNQICNVVCYGSRTLCYNSKGKEIPEDSEDPTKICHNVIQNEENDLKYGPDKIGVDGYMCVNSLLSTDALNGENSPKVGDNLQGPGVVCYPSYWECVDFNGNHMSFNGYKPEDENLSCHKVRKDSVFPLYGGVSPVEQDKYICSRGNDNNYIINSRSLFSWVGDLFPDGLIYEVEDADGNLIGVVQGVFVDLGLMEQLSISHSLDILTQGVLSNFQHMNGIDQTGALNEETISLLNNIISGAGEIFGGSQAAIINDYISNDSPIGLGTYNEDVQTIQILLYDQGYEISQIDGVFNQEVCSAVSAYSEDNNLELSDVNNCILSDGILESFNNLIRSGDYLGSGFVKNGNGYLVGSGILNGKNGPGMIGFEVKKAEANSLREGDVVLIYTFLDEKTILITRDEVVIPEVIKRRALHDIFNKENDINKK